MECNISDIANKSICLKLNKKWEAVGIGPVSKTICDLMSGVVLAMDIVYTMNKDGSPNFDSHEYLEPVEWDKWITLPVRPWDISIRSIHLHIRVPTVVITKNYAKVHEKKFKGKPSREGLAIRDNLIDAYTGEELDFHASTIDHVLPLSRGGTDTYDNTVLTTKEINNRKGNRLNSEVGLKLLINPHMPKPVPVSHTIRRVRNRDWAAFLTRAKR